MARWIIISIMMCVCSSVYAQNSISGRTVNSEAGEPLPYSTVTVTDASGSYLTATAADEKGTFKIENLPEGKYILECKFAGYQTRKIEVVIEQKKDVDVGEVKLDKRK